MEMKPNTFIRDFNCYAYIQFIREKFWLQLWTLKKFTKPRMSRNSLLRNGKNGKTCTFLQPWQ